MASPKPTSVLSPADFPLENECQTLPVDTSPHSTNAAKITINQQLEDPPQTPSGSTTAAEPEDAFPDGGLRAWLVIAGSFLCMVFTWGFATAFGVLAEYYRTTLLPENTPTQIAWISSLQYCLLMLPGMFVGRLFDAGYFKPIITFGMILLVISQIIVSFTDAYWELLLSQGLASGLGLGIVFSMAITVPAHWFKSRRGLAFGIVSSGSSVGGFVFPVMCKQLLPRVGFGWTMRVLGLMMLACFGLAWPVMKARLPPALHFKNGGWRHVRFLDASAFKDPAYALFTLGSTLFMFGMFTPFTYINTFATMHQLPFSDYYLSILNGASLFGRTIPGFLADRYGALNTFVPHLYASAILVFLFPLCTGSGAMVTFAILYGFSSGAFASLLAPCSAQLGSTDTVGTRLGMAYACMSLGGLLGLPISGAILGNGGGRVAERSGTGADGSGVEEHLTTSDSYNWWGAFSYAGACILAGAVCVHLSRQSAVRGSICVRRRCSS